LLKTIEVIPDSQNELAEVLIVKSNERFGA